MLLGFKTRFAPFILDGRKQHTIRATRKIRVRVGETCHCYTGLRQKGAKLLGRWPCVKIEDIHIARGARGLSILIDGELLDADEREALARRDGFASLDEMAQFWEGRLPFAGTVIHWRWTSEVAAK